MGASLMMLCGEQYLVDTRTLADTDLLDQWVKDRVPQPLKRLHERASQFDGSMYAEIVRKYIDEAMKEQDKWPPAPGSQEFWLPFRTPEGAAFLLWLALRRRQPEFTREEASRVIVKVDSSEEEGGNLGMIFRRFIIGDERKLTPRDLLDPKDGSGPGADTTGADGSILSGENSPDATAGTMTPSVI